MYVCIKHRSFIFQSSSGIERLGHEGRKDMGRLGSWMQPHIDRIGERVGQVGLIMMIVMRMVRITGKKRLNSILAIHTYIFETCSPAPFPLHPLSDNISSLIFQVGQSLGERVGQVKKYLNKVP